MDSVYYVKIILTTKSILLPSVENPVVLGGFLLPLWLKDQTNLPDWKNNTNILYGYFLGKETAEKKAMCKAKSLTYILLRLTIRNIKLIWHCHHFFKIIKINSTLHVLLKKKFRNISNHMVFFFFCFVFKVVFKNMWPYFGNFSESGPSYIPLVKLQNSNTMLWIELYAPRKRKILPPGTYEIYILMRNNQCSLAFLW